jgi:hypothetical protein
MGIMGVDVAALRRRQSTDQEQRMVAEKLGAGFTKQLSATTGFKGRVDWRVSGETPICEACGSGPPL